MNKNLLSGLTGLMLPLASYGMAPMTYGTYQRKQLAQMSGDQLLDLAKQASLRAPAVPASHEELSLQSLGAARELVIIDAAVPDKQAFTHMLKPGVDVEMIDSDKDGLSQLASILERYRGLDAIHLVSHAADGELQLGNGIIGRAELEANPAIFDALHTALVEGGDLLFYGCDLAATEKGEAFLWLIQHEAGVDVAASIDKTGDVERGGDWELEIRTGRVDRALPFDKSALKDFSDVLSFSGTLTLSNMPVGYANSKSYTIPSTSYEFKVKSGGSGNQDLYNYSTGYVYVSTSTSTQTTTDVYFAGGEQFDLSSLYVYQGFGSSTKTIQITSDKGGIQNSSAAVSASSGTTINFSGSNWAGIKRFTIRYSDNTPMDWVKIDNIALSNLRASSDSDGSVIAGASVSEPVGLPSTVSTAGGAVNLFDFTLTDGGTSDGLPMTVSQVTVNVSGTTSDAVRGNIVWRLNGNDANNIQGTYNAGSDTITFSGLNISIADGDTSGETYTVNAYFQDNTNVTEDQTIILSLDGDTDLTLANTGTQMGPTSAVTNGSGTTIDVVATELRFTTQPAGSVSGSALTTQPVVTATDSFGNTDVDFGETITLTEASAGTLTNNTQTAVNGVATFTGLTYTATSDQQSFTLTANDQDGVGSDLATVYANAVTSDVVATKLLYTTQPAPTAVNSGVATSFTTVPVVSAVDSNNTVDTGYSTDITLAEVNGAGSATMTGTGDTDGNGATVSITPSSGVSTFTGMQITYTASGGGSEPFNLQASSGGLSTANSNQLTGVVNDPPAIGNLNGDNVAWSGVSSTVILDASSDAVVSDAELDALNGGNGDYSGASLTVQRAGGANSDDLFGFDIGGALFRNSGSNLQSGGLTFATFTNTNGVLTINFTSSGTSATTTLVSDVVRHLTYRNDALSGDTSVRFALSDGLSNTMADVTVEDVIGPSVTSVDSNTADGTYKAGDAVSVQVGFGEAVTVAGTPGLTLETGATDRTASYSSGSGTSTLTFSYTVQSGDSSSDLDYVSTGALSLNGGTIKDSSGNAATLSLPSPGAANSLGANKSIVIDTAAPELAEVSVTTPTNDTTPSIQFTTTEAGTLAVGGSCGSGDEGAVSSGSQTITLTQTDNSSALPDGTYSDCTVTVTDAAGNASSALTLSAFTVDTIAPTGHNVSFDDDIVDSTEASSTSFTFSNAEIGASYSYSISSNQGGTPVTGSGTIASVNQQVSGIDVSGLADGTLALSATLTDTAGNSAVAVTDTTTLDANEPPIGVGDAAVLNEDESALVDILANDTDDKDELSAASVHVISAPAHGRVQVRTGNGLVLYTPDANYSGADSFSYTVEDGQGKASGAATVSLLVNAVNDAPAAAADTVSTQPGQAVNLDLLANDSDPDDALDANSIKLVVNAANGVADVTNGTLNYTPDDGFTGTDKLSYIVYDQAGDVSNVADVFINVYANNQAPVATADSTSTASNTVRVIDVLGNDTDSDSGDNLDVASVAITQWPHDGSISVNTGTGEISYTPDSDFKGDDRFAYVVADAAGAFSPAATVTVTVGAGEAPVARNDQVRLVSEDTNRINILGNDGDAGITLVPGSVSIVGSPSQGSVSIDSATGDLLYTPDAGFSGTDTLTYTVQDSNSVLSSVATVTIGQLPINAVPLANDDWQVLDEDSAPTLTILGNDADADGALNAASIVQLSSPSKGSVSVSGGQVTYTPDADAYGEDRFVYQVADDQGTYSDPAVVRLRITPKAEVPQISGSPTRTVAVGNAYSFVPVAVDANDQPLTFSISNRPTWAFFDTVTGRLSGKPDAGNVGSTANIVISVSNGDESASLPAFSLQVTEASGTSDTQDGGTAVGSSGPVGDDTDADLQVVDASDPKLIVDQGTWPTYTDDQPPRARYILDYVDQQGARHTVSVTVADATAPLPTTSGPDAQGRQTLLFGGSGDEQVVTLWPDGKTRVEVTSGGTLVSTFNSRAKDLGISVAASGQVTSSATFAGGEGSSAAVKLVQPADGGVRVNSTYKASAGASGKVTTHQFELEPAEANLTAEGAVTVQGDFIDGGETVTRRTRIEPTGTVSLVGARSDAATRAAVARDPGSSSSVGIGGVVGLTLAPVTAAIALDNTLTYDGGTVASCDAVALTGGFYREICLDNDPDLNGLDRSAEVSSESASGNTLISRLEITDTDNGNEMVYVEQATDRDGYIAQRALSDGTVSVQVRLDGSSMQQVGGRSGLADNVVTSLLPNNLSLLFNDRAITVADSGATTFYLEALVNGEVHHEVALNGLSTQAISDVPGTRTLLANGGDGRPVVMTRAEYEGRQIQVVGQSDGQASHAVTNCRGVTSHADFGIPGTYTTIAGEGTVRSRVRLGDGYTCAWVETFANGETNTGFGSYDESSARCVDIAEPTNEGNPFEAGNEVSIEGDGSNASITVETQLTRPIQF